jgi:hypothetical protein
VADTRFRAVGHRRGSKQLLNTSAGLVPTVVRKELIVHGRLVQSKEPTILRSSLEPGSEFFRTRELRGIELANAGHFPCHCSCRATNGELCRTRELYAEFEVAII